MSHALAMLSGAIAATAIAKVNTAAPEWGVLFIVAGIVAALGWAAHQQELGA